MIRAVMKWILIVSAFASNEVTCPEKHGLKRFKTTIDNTRCIQCGNSFKKNETLFGCGICNFNLCPICCMIYARRREKKTTKDHNYTSAQLSLETSDIYGNEKLHYASKNGDEKTVKLLLNAFAHEEEPDEKLIEFVKKENKIKFTALHFASQNGNEEIVKLLLNVFKEKETLIDYLMKESATNHTAFHFACQSGNEEIIKLFLNAFSREEKEKEKLIRFLMKESGTKNTGLHYASKNGHEEIIKLLLHEFGKKEKYLLIGFLNKQNYKRYKAVDVALMHGNEKVVTLLTEAIDNLCNM